MSERFTVPLAVHVFLREENRIMLLKRHNTGYEDGNYSVIAGHLDGGESVAAAAVREAKEEAGIEIRPEDVQVVGIMHRKENDERVDFFVEVCHWVGEPINMEPNKCDELAWYSVDKLPANVIPYIRRALDNARNGIYFDTFGSFDQANVLQ
ncbi:NUDIX domain-containing protein [Paenibacillus allorhizosphaerae]|uniref:NADH pyrophosphatase n=1 Tax=Paenibacillus allorhizosphaerae TaxID=2849866 RepID=A0ABM8VI32_9BACL|nr:NUDIX domain-containing protein [Paenibacillus allorhizosphaerae]CAG7643444.1 NADH pyrophosphatase [Paenibacillus allorhizosphaerae]